MYGKRYIQRKSSGLTATFSVLTFIFRSLPSFIFSKNNVSNNIVTIQFLANDHLVMAQRLID